MNNQFFNLACGHLINVVLWLHDRHMDFCEFLNAAKMKAIIVAWYIIAGYQYLFCREPRLLHAHMYPSREDVTIPVWFYYMYDPICSPASLYRWLYKFGYTEHKIYIVFACNKRIHAARINILDDIEEITNCSIDDLGLAKINVPEIF